MPVVRMRRTSRGMYGARVLRSGRRVLTSAPILEVPKQAKAGPANDWIDLEEEEEDDHHIIVLKKQKGSGKNKVKVVESRKSEEKMDVNESIDNSIKKWDNVYVRKRKRADTNDSKYGLKYVRKRKGMRRSCVFLAVVVESLSCGGDGVLGGFLSLVLKYMTSVELGLSQLSEFVVSEGFSRGFLSRGVRFIWDSPLYRRSGVCKIFGANCFVPLFVVDFSALPSCFMYMHSSLFLRSVCLTLVLEHPYTEDDGMVMDEEIVADYEMVEVVQHLPCISTSAEAASLEIKSVASANANPGKKSPSKVSVGIPRITRSVTFKSSVNTRSIQKRRTLRSRGLRSSTALRGRKVNGALFSNVLSFRHDKTPLSPVKSIRQPNSLRRSTSLVELPKNIASASCSANILVIELIKCYRIVGAVVKLEKSPIKGWSLAVKKDGKPMYHIKARDFMRPCSSNRVTHDIIWREDDNDWKLEFPERSDWMIFKELYKECLERNMRAFPADIIPVPNVQEVSDYAETNSATFTRPNLYITTRGDELTRALAKETANYIMDSEDEKWLNKLNRDSSVGNEHWEHVSEDVFEMIIDVLEKAFFRSPDDLSDDKAAADVCLHLERREVIQAVYSYWVKKRKQKRSALVRVFQCYQPRRTQMISKPFIRKKRSFKRQPSHHERAKQRTFLPIVVVEPPDPLEEQKAKLKVEEAKAATARSMNAAIEKRKKAQLLMESADVATYKAAMALRIAEAARIAESSDFSYSFLLE